MVRFSKKIKSVKITKFFLAFQILRWFSSAFVGFSASEPAISNLLRYSRENGNHIQANKKKITTSQGGKFRGSQAKILLERDVVM